jgi:hypothetical protein
MYKVGQQLALIAGAENPNFSKTNWSISVLLYNA